MMKIYYGVLLVACSVCFYILYMNGLMSWNNGFERKMRGSGLAFENDESVYLKQNMNFSKTVIDLLNAKNCVLGFIHIQKAGGTHLEQLLTSIKGLECRCPGRKRHGSCRCLRPGGEPWIVMRYVGFKIKKAWPCGVHPDYGVLSKCIPKLMHYSFGEDFNPQVLLFTTLRDPVQRYLSEFRHVQRGATWGNAKVKCRKAKKCYDGSNWIGVSLSNFMKCKSNPAINRQTRMLADLRSTKCSAFYHMSKNEKDRFLYNSATKVLGEMIFFALTEKPAESQFIFEKTFHVKFNNDWKLFDTGYSKEYMKNVSSEDIQKIKDINYLDLKLYQFASNMFAKRLKYFEELSSEKPKETEIMKHKKGLNVLQKNWKNKRMKSKTRKANSVDTGQ